MDYTQKFFFAIRSGDASEVRRLLDDNPELANLREARSLPGLHLAAQRGQTEIATLLLERGAQLEATCGNIGSTPLKYAVFFAQIDMVKVLLKAGADLDNCGNNSRTPLELALSATEPMFRRMGTPGSDLDYARIANILRGRTGKHSTPEV